jgi:hypothetical protein
MKTHAPARISAAEVPASATSMSRRLAFVVTAVWALGSACGDDPPGLDDAGGDAAVMDARPADVPSGDARPDSGADVTPDAHADLGSVDVADGADAAAMDAAADAGDGGKPDAADGGGIANQVWPADAIKLVAEDRGGGFAPSPPAGSACQWSGTYTWTVATKNLAWRLCQPAAPGAPYQTVVGQRVLTDFERDALVAALAKVAVTTAPSCGADKGILALKVTTPAGEKEYLDNFYQCQKQGVYVTNIDGVFQVLRQLVK